MKSRSRPAAGRDRWQPRDPSTEHETHRTRGKTWDTDGSEGRCRPRVSPRGAGVPAQQGLSLPKRSGGGNAEPRGSRTFGGGRYRSGTPGGLRDMPVAFPSGLSNEKPSVKTSSQLPRRQNARLERGCRSPVAGQQGPPARHRHRYRWVNGRLAPSFPR